MKVWIVNKDGRICRNCKHFVQHYVKMNGSFAECEAGHCKYPRIKEREPTDSCKFFTIKADGCYTEE